MSREKKEKIYVVWGGDYVTSCEDGYCGWTPYSMFAKFFSTYAKAYALKKKVDRAYHYDRCSVFQLKESDYLPRYWEQMLENRA